MDAESGSNPWAGQHSKLDLDDLHFNRRRAEIRVLDNFKATVKSHLGSTADDDQPFSGLSAVEMGAGTGTVSMMLALGGAEVTLVDYSTESLDQARRIFDHFDLMDRATFVLGDLTQPELDLSEAFDLSHSWGVIEHFRSEEERQLVIQHHINYLKPTAASLISVPHSGCIPLQIYLLMRRAMFWMKGAEFPLYFAQHLMARSDFERGLAKYGDEVRIDSVIGSSIYESYLPHVILRNKRIRRQKRADLLKAYPRTFLDDYLGYGILVEILKGDPA